MPASLPLGLNGIRLLLLIQSNLYWEGRRVGLFDTNDDFDTSYFDSVTMVELFGHEFNEDNFGIGITFGKFNQTGLTDKECNEKQNTMNIQIKSADEVFQSYLTL
jgi:hypothetical protein